MERSISFKQSNQGALSGFLTYSGLVGYDADELVLEFEVRDGVINSLIQPLKQIRIPLSQLQHVEYRHFWIWWKRVVIQVRSLKTLGDFSLREGNQIVLKVQGKSSNLNDFVQELNLRISTAALNRLDPGNPI